MATQSTYSERIAPPSPGTTEGTDYENTTGICETVAGIGFGLAVSKGSSSDQGVVLGGALAGFRGVSVKDITLPAGNADKFLPPNSLSVRRRGQIWTEPGEAVNADDPVYYNSTTGVFYKSAAAGRVGPVAGARFETSCGVGGRAKLYVSGFAQKYTDLIS